MEILTACWVIFMPLLMSTDFFKINIFKKNFRKTIRLSYCLDPDQTQHFVGPDLGPNCLQRLSADVQSCHLVSMEQINLAK